MQDPDTRVSNWLDSGYAESVVSGYTRPANSEYGEFDDSLYRLVEDEVPREEQSAGDVAVVSGALLQLARAAQRKTVSSFYRSFTRGRMLDYPVYGTVDGGVQKFFRVESFTQLSSLEDPTLVDALSKGTVRTRVAGETAMGKTFKLPGMLAAKCGLRVCQVELDADISKEALQYQKRLYGIPGGARAWSREKKAYLSVMSYDEFRGIVLSGSRDRLFEDFDLFYFDEAHAPLATVWAARQYFASFARPDTSLLIASATVSTQSDNNAVARSVGKFKVEETPMSLEGALESGKLLGEHLRDRTLFLVASDESVALARAYYLESGIEVMVLDSASTTADRMQVVKALSVPTAVVPRVLVATEPYGTMYSFPVSFVISTCTQRVYDLTDGNALVEKEVPLMEKAVVQHQGRVGRGVATGAGGWLLSSARVVDKELLPSEALEAYLSLVAAGIRPRPGVFDRVTRVLPKGMNASVARMLLRVGLPVALSVRYLGSDGRFARKYLEGIRLFAQSGEVLRPSKDEEPVGYAEWVEERVGEYYVGDDSKTAVYLRVPFASPPGLKVQMHTVTAVSTGLLDLDYWDWYEEDEESDDENIGIRTRVVRKAVPRMPEPGFARTVASETPKTSVWKYDADPGAARVKSKRHGMSWTANGEGRAAVTALLRAMESESLGTNAATPVFDAPEFSGKVAFSLPLEEEPMIAVKSAGGGKVLLVDRRVHDKFMSGELLSSTETVGVFQHLEEIRAVERFAKSTVFDNWSPAWSCWFSTYASVGVLQALKQAGLHSSAIKFLGLLYERFRAEVLSVAASSNLYREKVRGFFTSKPSVTRFVSAVKRGKLPIAQTDAFVQCVIKIKEDYDVAVLAMEEVGLYAPSLVTGAQARLPIRDRVRRLETIDDEVVEGVGTTRLRGVVNHGRKPSWLDKR